VTAYTGCLKALDVYQPKAAELYDIKFALPKNLAKFANMRRQTKQE
jgi:hypothetical protein